VVHDPYSWIEFTDAMCNGDILKHEPFFRLNWIYALNVQTMRLIKQEKEFEKNKVNE